MAVTVRVEVLIYSAKDFPWLVVFVVAVMWVAVQCSDVFTSDLSYAESITINHTVHTEISITRYMKLVYFFPWNTWNGFKVI